RANRFQQTTVNQTPCYWCRVVYFPNCFHRSKVESGRLRSKSSQVGETVSGVFIQVICALLQQDGYRGDYLAFYICVASGRFFFEYPSAFAQLCQQFGYPPTRAGFDVQQVAGDLESKWQAFKLTDEFKRLVGVLSNNLWSKLPQKLKRV